MLKKLKTAALLAAPGVLLAAPAFATDPTMPDLTTMGSTVTSLTGNINTLVAAGATIIGGVIAIRFLRVGSGAGFSFLSGLGKK